MEPLSAKKIPEDATPVIVVGSGLAGLAAAAAALEAGAGWVRVLERAAKPGGNSIKASSGISASGTQYQKSEDTTFWYDTIKSAGNRYSAAPQMAREQRQDLIATLTSGSAAAIEFLTKFGVDLSVVTQLGGHSEARTHRGSGTTPPGMAIINSLLGKLWGDEKYSSRFELVTGCEVTKILTEPVPAKPASVHRPAEPATTKVVGVVFKKGDVMQNMYGPVVFATGGFAGDTQGLLATYRSDLSGLPSTNEPRPGMHRLLQNAGARLIDMDSVQVHPTGFVDPAQPKAHVKFLAAEMLRGEGGVLLYKGRRFVNELETREHVSEAIMNLPPEESEDGPKQWDIRILLDGGVAEAAKGHVGFYLWKNLLRKVNVSSLDETTRETLDEYAGIIHHQRRDKLGRLAHGHWTSGRYGVWDEDAEVFVGKVTPVVHFTMGGVVIDRYSQVLSSELGASERPIPNLWAAGEVTGGIHGDNRLGGSSLLECVVFGRQAGELAARASWNFEAKIQ